MPGAGAADLSAVFCNAATVYAVKKPDLAIRMKSASLLQGAGQKSGPDMEQGARQTFGGGMMVRTRQQARFYLQAKVSLQALLMIFMVLALAGQAQAGSIRLAGSEWQPASAPSKGVRPFVQFGSSGRVSGSDGCNRLMGTYVQKGSKLRISRLAGTRRMCAAGIMRRARAFTRALSAARRYQASHLRLTLKSASGKTLMQLRRRDFD